MTDEDRPLDYAAHIPEDASDGDPLLVLLHGRGSSEKDLLALAPMLPRRTVLVAPRAPYPAAPWGYGPGWAWYRYVSEDRVVDDTLAHSLQALDELMIRLHGELPIRSDMTVLGGFSQGGTTSLAWGLTRPGRLDGVANFSGFLVISPIVGVSGESVADLPIFWGHGKRDPMIPFALAERGRTTLREVGADLEMADHAGGHQITNEEIAAFGRWMSGLSGRS